MPLFDIQSLKPYNQLNEQELLLLDKVHKSCDLLLEAVDRVCRKYGITYFLGCGNLLGAYRHGGTIPWDDDVDIWMYPSQYEILKEHADELGEDFRLVSPEEYSPYYVDSVPRIMYLPSHFHDDEQRAQKLKGLMEHIHLDIFLMTSMPEKGFRQKLFRYKFIFLYALANAHRYHIPFENYNLFQKIVGFVLCLIGRLIPATWIIKTSNRWGKKTENVSSYPYVLFYNDDLRSLLRTYYKEDFSQSIDMKYDDLTVMAPVGYERCLEVHYYGNYKQIPPPEKQIAHMASLENITFDK